MSDRVIHTRYGSLSRGKCWGKWYAGQTGPRGNFEWVPKDGGTLYIPDGPGFLQWGSNDGFSRKESHSETYS